MDPTAAAQPPPPSIFKDQINDPAALPAVVLSAVLPAITTLIVALRLTLRRLQRFGWGIDDYLATLALLNIWILSTLTILGWHIGLGRHRDDVPYAYWTLYLKGLFVYDIFYVLGIGLVKLSILFFYERVFAIERRVLILLRCLEAFILCWVVATIIASIFECTPVSYFWTRVKLAPGSCVDLTSLAASQAALNVATDVLIYIFPIPIVWKLHISKRKKIGVIIVFLSGAVVVALSIVRASSLQEILSEDFTYADVKTSSWSMTESCVGLITACLPTTKSVFMAWTRRFGSQTTTITSYTPHFDRSWPSTKSANVASGTRRGTHDSDSELTGIRISADGSLNNASTGESLPMQGIRNDSSQHWPAHSPV
ncbi:MAG: hypothetical protein M4579_002910 [Chaenotheca gracillima]|nr:MAG: hypothetical protein M4579_002910 [Chaenotheca gracillima]